MAANQNPGNASLNSRAQLSQTIGSAASRAASAAGRASSTARSLSQQFGQWKADNPEDWNRILDGGTNAFNTASKTVWRGGPNGVFTGSPEFGMASVPYSRVPLGEAPQWRRRKQEGEAQEGGDEQDAPDAPQPPLIGGAPWEPRPGQQANPLLSVVSSDGGSPPSGGNPPAPPSPGDDDGGYPKADPFSGWKPSYPPAKPTVNPHGIPTVNPMTGMVTVPPPTVDPLAGFGTGSSSSSVQQSVEPPVPTADTLGSLKPKKPKKPRYGAYEPRPTQHQTDGGAAVEAMMNGRLTPEEAENASANAAWLNDLLGPAPDVPRRRTPKY